MKDSQQNVQVSQLPSSVDDVKKQNLPTSNETGVKEGGDVSRQRESEEEFNKNDLRDWRSELFFWSPGGNCPC